MDVLIINNYEVKEFLKMETCIRLMEDTFKSLARKESDQPLRSWLQVEKGILGLMPSYSDKFMQMGVKAVSVFPGNQEKDLPSHMGVVLLFDSETGQLLSIQDGEEITATRTAAASAAATKKLCSKKDVNLAILGSGVQADKHIESISLVCNPVNIKVWSRNNENASKLIGKWRNQFGNDISAEDDVKKTVEDADIICTVTSSKDPILLGANVKDGAHINAVGSCTPDARELDTELMQRVKIYTDSIESLENEAGDYLIPLNEGNLTTDDVVGEIGDLLIGKISGRGDEKETTLFKSLGIGVEDLTVANYLYETFKEKSLGTLIEF